VRPVIAVEEFSASGPWARNSGCGRPGLGRPHRRPRVRPVVRCRPAPCPRWAMWWGARPGPQRCSHCGPAERRAPGGFCQPWRSPHGRLPA